MNKNNQQWPSNMPWYANLFVYMLGFVVDITRRADGSVNRRLLSFFDLKSSSSEKPIEGVKSTDITIDETRNLWFRLYTPTTVANGSSLPVIFYFHGGGFAFFAPNSKLFDNLCRELARKLSSFVISVNYRLAPEHPYPTQIEDCFDALKFIDTEEIEGFSNNADRKRCFMAGDSAGGNLVHHVALKAASENVLSRVKLIGNILIQPFFGGEERTESELRLTKAPFITLERTDWMWKSLLPMEGSNRDHPVANVFGPNSIDISEINFPATIVFVGGFDPLKDWERRYYEGLKKHGKEAYLVEYENAFHTFYLFPKLPEFGLFRKEMKDFMQKQSTFNM